MERKFAWEKYSEEDLKKVFDFAEGYKDFMTHCKTERECTAYFIDAAKKAGYKDLDEVIARGEKLSAGDRVYRSNYGKALAVFIVGKKPVEEGINILGAHIDSPRLDLKQVPLYEDATSKLVLLDTHYYGGIKKYQWTTLPLALHGVIAKKDGTVQPVVIGEDPSDPVVGVSELLIHLSHDLMTKPAAEVVEGESLDVMVGSMPLKDSGESAGDDKKAGEAVKANILALLAEKYGMTEEDFLSAEIEVVPAGAARDYGLDRSMIMTYGQDDRSCAYPSFMAMLGIGTPERTAAGLFVDKEEVGSIGATGMQSSFYEDTVAELVNATTDYSELKVRRAMSRSMALSSDVSAGYDPNYPQVMEVKNAAFLGKGVCFNKYTGRAGKAGSNDASAEYMAEIRKCMEDDGVTYQTCELGKVDVGGGGTIAYILGNYDMKVIDCGVPVLNMHAPWEIISKADLYEAYRCYTAFIR